MQPPDSAYSLSVPRPSTDDDVSAQSPYATYYPGAKVPLFSGGPPSQTKILAAAGLVGLGIPMALLLRRGGKSLIRKLRRGAQAAEGAEGSAAAEAARTTTRTASTPSTGARCIATVLARIANK